MKKQGKEKKLIIYPSMQKKNEKINVISISDIIMKYARPIALRIILESL